MDDPLLVQYQILSDQRLHFGRLFWQSIAFLFLLLLACTAVFKGLEILPDWGVLWGFGAVTILMGFVAERLRRLESQYEDLLETIETSLQAKGHVDIQISPRSGKFGSRFVITLGLFVLGAGLILLGFLAFFGVSIR